MENGLRHHIDPFMLPFTSLRRPSETSTVSAPGEHIDHAPVPLLAIAIR